MNILTAGRQEGEIAPAGRWVVRCNSVCPPWWGKGKIGAGVAQIVVEGLFSCHVHVRRSRGGRWFANMPTNKRGDEWISTLVVLDPDLERAIVHTAIAAVQQMIAADHQREGRHRAGMAGFPAETPGFGAELAGFSGHGDEDDDPLPF